MKKKLLIALLLSLSLTSIADTTSSTLTQKKSIHSTPISVIPNETFQIVLKANEKENLHWTWKSDQYIKNLITLVSQKYFPKNDHQFLDPAGCDVFTFRANVANYRVTQVGHIVMQYPNPTNSQNPITKTFILHVRAQNKQQTTSNANGSASASDHPFTSPSKPIVVGEKNSIFVITLQSNPTTGYSWSVDKQKTNLTLIRILGHKYVAPTNTKLIGAPGYEAWMFQVKHHAFKNPQTTPIVMTYARPWEKEKTATETTFTVQIQ